MSFDPAKVPGGDVAQWGRECRAAALAGVRAADWRPVFDWTKSWIGWGGGAWLPDAWVLYAVSALLDGMPRNAVHSLDLGLKIWLEGEVDRAAMTWLRGIVVMDRLGDPKTALADLEHSLALLPEWLQPGSSERISRCGAEALRSRKWVPTVKPRPPFVGAADMRHVVAPVVDVRSDGDEPEVWRHVAIHFQQ